MYETIHIYIYDYIHIYIYIIYVYEPNTFNKMAGTAAASAIDLGGAGGSEASLEATPKPVALCGDVVNNGKSWSIMVHK